MLRSDNHLVIKIIWSRSHFDGSFFSTYCVLLKIAYTGPFAEVLAMITT